MRYHPFAHLGFKIVSLALAVLLWMMVSAQRASVERGLRIPLEVQKLPDNVEMVDPPQDTVDVRVRGTADVMGRLGPGDLVATIDLSTAQPGRRLFHISPDRVKAPFAVEVTQVVPASVAIRSGAMTVSPSGFCQPEAIFARNLFGATPAEAVSWSSSLICCLMRSATFIARGSPHRFSVTSR